MKKTKKSACVALKKLVFHCPKLKRQVTIKLDNAWFSTNAHDCELCGAHGDMKVAYDCKCGQTHDVHIKSW
jgi:hypothetical protein